MGSCHRRTCHRSGYWPLSLQLPEKFLVRQLETGLPKARLAAEAQLAQQLSNARQAMLQLFVRQPANVWGSSLNNSAFYVSARVTQEALADPHVSSETKIAMLRSYYATPQDEPILQSLAAAGQNPALREAALIHLVQLGVAGTAMALGRLSDQVHAFAHFVWPAAVMTAVATADPKGYIATGMNAVAALNGTAYVDTARCQPERPFCAYWLMTSAQYNPTRGGAWRSLLKRYGAHPGADDISYVMGRDEEIMHHYRRAILAFWQALSLPDGDMYDAALQRLYYVIGCRKFGPGPAAHAEYWAAQHIASPGALRPWRPTTA